MSFITLQSSRNETSPQALDSSYFRNDFKSGILVKPGDTISLVNLTINTAAEFVINDSNDTIVFRLGNTTTYYQVVAKLQHGAYDGATMESVVETALNEAVVGGIWKRANTGPPNNTQYGFQCTYDKKNNPNKPEFKIDMVQQVREGENLSDKEGYEAIYTYLTSGNEFNTELITTVHQPGASPLYHIDANFEADRQGSIDAEYGTFSQIDLAEKGIFLNGGSVVMDCEPVKGIDTSTPANAIASFTNLYQGGTGGLTGDVWQVNLSGDNPQSWLLDGASAPSSAEACNLNTTGSGNWDLKLTFVHAAEDGSGGSQRDFYLHSRSHENPGEYNGVFVMGLDGSTDPEDSANWDAPIPFWYWDKDNGRLVGSPNQQQIEERFNEGYNSLISHALVCTDPANLITATLVNCVGYNAARIGICRQQFYYGDKDIDDEALNTSPTGMDASIAIIPNLTGGLIPKLDCSRIVAKQGKVFGQSGWRDGNNSGRVTFPTTMGQTPSLDDPQLFGSAFTAGCKVRIGIEYTGLISYNMFIEMATVLAPDSWVTRTNVFSVGRATDPVSLVHQSNSPIKQSMWNIRAVSAYGGGGFYDPAHYVLRGINDRENYEDIPNLEATPATEPHTESLMRFTHNATPQNADLVGTWRIEQYSVGPYPGSTDWHVYNDGTDPHYDDDRYVFEMGGRFDNVFGPDGTTELEAWQGAQGEGAPVAPHDNSAYSTYVYSATGPNGVPTLQLNGKGSYVGLAKVIDNGELTDSANTPDSRTYDIPYFTTTELHLVMPINNGAAFWTFKLIKESNDIITVPAINEELTALTTTVNVLSNPDPITTLKTLFKFGRVGSGDLGSDADIEPNISNANDLLGMNRFLEGTNLANTFPIISANDPEGSVADLSLMVCLEDFNITGKNGGTGDDTKIIAVVPKEKFEASTSNVNIMHYTAEFPIAIDLNPVTEQTFYSLTASLRDMRGKFLRSLESPTHITLLHERDKKSAMAEAVSNAIEKANERKANIQSNIITNAGINNPRI